MKLIVCCMVIESKWRTLHYARWISTLMAKCKHFPPVYQAPYNHAPLSLRTVPAMQISLKNALILLSTVIMLTACSEPEDTRPGQPVKTRQTAFKEILRVFEPMGTMLRQDRYEADKFEALAERLVRLRDAPWSHFGADTHYPPSKGTPNIWQQPEQFTERRDAFLRATDLLLASAHGKDESQIRAAYKKVHDTCQDCHKTFKSR